MQSLLKGIKHTGDKEIEYEEIIGHWLYFKLYFELWTEDII